VFKVQFDAVPRVCPSHSFAILGSQAE